MHDLRRRGPSAPQRAWVIAVCGALALVLAGAACAAGQPGTAAPVDTPTLRVGQLVLTGVHVKVSAQGESGILVGTIRNDSTTSDVLFLSIPGAPVTPVVIDGSGSITLGPRSREVTVATLEPPDRGPVELTVQSTTYGTHVLDAEMSVGGA